MQLLSVHSFEKYKFETSIFPLKVLTDATSDIALNCKIEFVSGSLQEYERKMKTISNKDTWMAML